MKHLILPILIILILATPVSAMEFIAPTVPDSVEIYMPENTESFGDGIWYIFKQAITNLYPSIADASRICMTLIVASLLISLLQSFSERSKRIVELVGTLMISVFLIQPSNTLIQLGTETIMELSEYGKLLLPVMSAAVAAQGGATTSAALYMGTTIFSTLLVTMISKLIVPLIYIYLCVCIANSAIGEEVLKKLCEFLKWLMTWCLKTVLYLFMGYMGITGVVSGSADAAAVKAAKLTISSMVPVVGGILSDASETILVSASVMKNAAGVYGLFAFIAIWIEPFLKIGLQYILLKLTSATCMILGTKQSSALVQDFSGAMGFVLGMVGTVSLLLMISTVCFMKGVS